MHNAIRTNQKTKVVLYVIQCNHKIVFVFHFSSGESARKPKFVLENYGDHKNLFGKRFYQEQDIFLKSKHSAHFGCFL